MLQPSVWGETNMAGRSDAFTIEGTVRRDSWDPMYHSHRICIAAKDGDTYQVEPRYLGLYVDRFEGRRVVARVHAVPNSKERNMVRILRLKVLEGETAEATSEAAFTVFPRHADNQEHVLSVLDVGETEPPRLPSAPEPEASPMDCSE